METVRETRENGKTVPDLSRDRFRRLAARAALAVAYGASAVAVRLVGPDACRDLAGLDAAPPPDYERRPW